MALLKKTFKSIKELQEHIRTHTPSFYYSSQTSTVIPYDHLEEVFKEDNFYLCDLSQMPKSMEILESGLLKIKGAVSWKDAKDFLVPKGLTIKTSPTEELALISGGAATSATGERYFHFGNLRSQIPSLEYIDFNGDIKTLHKDQDIEYDHLEKYKQDTSKYKDFKNPPYPVFEKATDLMIGTEGQLGVITSLELEVTKDCAVNHLFMLLPKWEEDFSLHMQIAKKIQSFRAHSHICEFIDSNAFSFLEKKDRPNQEKDAIFFEVKSELFEDFYENFILDIDGLDQDQVFELTASKFHQIRAGVPRAVFEENSQMGVKKMGTDVQVEIDDFADLFEVYKNFSEMGVRYNLFGHFGDGHLHFNFMPKDSDTKKCQEAFIKMYHQVQKLGASPFAEHGIGVIKQKFIQDYWSENQYNLFEELKNKHDPYNQFFPQGFMCLK